MATKKQKVAKRRRSEPIDRPNTPAELDAAQSRARKVRDEDKPRHDGGLKHSVGGVTTRDDALDLGVPMLPGSPNEPQGPEDALGPGPKRGDYTDRVGPANYHPHEGDAPQRSRARDRGDAKGLKGGVQTA